MTSVISDVFTYSSFELLHIRGVEQLRLSRLHVRLSRLHVRLSLLKLAEDILHDGLGVGDQPAPFLSPLLHRPAPSVVSARAERERERERV